MHGLCSWSIHCGIDKCVCDLRSWIGDGHTGIEWSIDVHRVCSREGIFELQYGVCAVRCWSVPRQ